MDFSLPEDIDELRRKVRAFVNRRLIPLEANPLSFDAAGHMDLALLESERAAARKEGLWAPQAPRELGGLGLPLTGWAAVYEEANRSLFGPLVMNCSAPDDGNMSVLAKVATPAQKERWLKPIIEGRVRSAFVMTEPRPGGGSDPSMIRTKAVRKGNRWVVDGRKWFITGAGDAAHFILIARTADDPRETRRHLSAFLFHRDDPGWRIVRRIPIMGPEEPGGHCELAFEGLEIPDQNRLMEVGDGLKLTQIRLGPARLTHCMRWLGLAKRSMEIAADYISYREGFGMRLADRESVQLKMGELAHDIQVGRLLVMHAAWLIDRGGRARKEISMAKVHCANALHRAADTAIQLNGARGYSRDTVLEWIYRYARQARLVDGADEVHKMVLAKSYAEEGNEFWAWGSEEGHET